MADPTVLTNPNKSIIPSVIAQLIQAGQGGDAQAVTGAADAGQNVSLPPPTVAQAAQATAPTVPDIPPNIQGAIGATQPPTPSADPFTDMVKPPQDAQPKLAPPHKSLGQKFMSALPYVGAAGAAMEAAGDPHGSGSGGKMLEQALQARNAAAAKHEELEKVHIPEAQAHARYYDSLNSTKIKTAQIGAEAKENVADTGADVKRELGRYKAVPGVGLFDTTTQQVIPGTAQGVILTADMAKSYDIPQDFIGKPVKLTDLAAKERADNGNLALTQGAKGPALVNKRQGNGKDLGLGSPAQASANNAAVTVRRVDSNTGKPYLTTITRAEQLRTGEPSAQVEFAEEGPTSQTRSMSQMATTLLPHLDNLEKFITDNSGLIGPVSGRLNKFLGGDVGTTGNYELDQKLGELRGSYKLFKGALARTHFGGRAGVQAAQYFDELMGAQTSAAGVLGVLESARPYIEGYKDMGGFTPTRDNAKQPGHAGGGKALDESTAKSYLQKANGDKVKARKLAAADGYQF